ncbi:pro-corazonin-like [Sitodiplosis mosellana]|uniref:pro-corazonin-like n=1 Tax=Sitodiplosis mosellana TaxID=263140 RepID=UPI0024441600|nr:pro-corazonin-like [Sitodiplosis mosellana]
MASKSELSIIILVCALISCSVAQTFQYSRGWVNGKRSGTSSSKAADHSDDIPDICKQFYLSEILAHGNPLSVHIIAHDYATNPQQIHSAAFYQRPQIKHDNSDLVPAAPYGSVESSSSPNGLDLSDRYKRALFG